ncbi:unnamed protein product [Ilex paraguariensis]|uniref:HECT-type E3 ubiquitin transferase n=1 Tax=Ilex paraguariensis TaxID=185542 RepID=A0ABC8RKG3_9AQUA
MNVGEQVQGSSSLSSPPLPPGTQRLLPFIEAYFVLCEKLQANNSIMQQDHSSYSTAREVKEFAGSSSPLSMKCGVDSQRRLDGAVTFARFAEKHHRLLNAFVRQNPGLLEKSLCMMLKAPRLIDFDNKRAYFRSRIRQQHDQHLSGPLRISVQRAYVLEDSYNQLRMRPNQDLKGRLNVHFHGEEGIDAAGLTREWYQLLSRVIFDKGALLFTTVGNNATFQPNPNSVYQTEHLSYFKFVGRVALFDGQLLDVYFTRSFYKHILGVKVIYHNIEAVDPDYYKNLKWMLENDVSDIPDLTFSMDADEEKLILYEKTEVTDYELKPGGRNIRVNEETKHEYVDLVVDHILTNAIRPQINSFLEVDDLKANSEYTGCTAASIVVQWFWEVVKAFNKEDMARFLQFITGTSKVPLEGFKALQGISGPQRFQIHKAYGAPERLPSAHTWSVLRSIDISCGMLHGLGCFVSGIGTCLGVGPSSTQNLSIMGFIRKVIKDWGRGKAIHWEQLTLYVNVLCRISFKSACYSPSMKLVKDLALVEINFSIMDVTPALQAFNPVMNAVYI